MPGHRWLGNASVLSCDVLELCWYTHTYTALPLAPTLGPYHPRNIANLPTCLLHQPTPNVSKFHVFWAVHRS